MAGLLREQDGECYRATIRGSRHRAAGDSEPASQLSEIGAMEQMGEESRELQAGDKGTGVTDVG